MKWAWTLAVGIALGFAGSIVAQDVGPPAPEVPAPVASPLQQAQQQVFTIMDQLGSCEINLGVAHRQLADVQSQLAGVSPTPE